MCLSRINSPSLCPNMNLLDAVFSECHSKEVISFFDAQCSIKMNFHQSLSKAAYHSRLVLDISRKKTLKAPVQSL